MAKIQQQDCKEVSFATCGSLPAPRPTYQHLALSWDEVVNLEQRKETGNGRNLTENFQYDGLNRLTSSQVVGSSAQTLTYNAIGNITHKSDVGSYSYGAGTAGPHAVTSAGGQSYSYDANGNNISGDGRSISYTSLKELGSDSN